MKDLFTRSAAKLRPGRALLYGGLGLVVLFAEIALTCAIPHWKNFFYTIIEKRLVDQFDSAMISFLGILLGLGIVQALKIWAAKNFSVECRLAASKVMLKQWVKRTGELRLPNYGVAQTDAIRNVTELFLEIAAEIFISASIIVVLIWINLDKPVIVACALAYTAAVMLVAKLFKKPMVNAEVDSQAAEGDYRSNITEIAENIHRFTAKQKLMYAMERLIHYSNVRLGFNIFTNAKAALAAVIPFLILSHQYFSGNLSFGELMQGASTFELIVANTTILVAVYPQIMKCAAARNILISFWKGVSNVEK